VPLLPATALASEGVTQVTLATGHALAVYRLGNEYFVSDDVCTHGEASLSDGEIEDGTIVCPYHQGSFDIRTGEARAYPCITPLRVYTVQIQSGSVCVLVDEAEAAPLSSP
jgi:p-cumate 2,3-dioxygenase ferredoxin subunit